MASKEDEHYAEQATYVAKAAAKTLSEAHEYVNKIKDVYLRNKVIERIDKIMERH